MAPNADYRLHPAAAEAFDKRAGKLFGELTKQAKRAAVKNPPLGGSAAHVPVVVHIENPSELVVRSTDVVSGELCAIEFKAEDCVARLEGRAATSLVELVNDVVTRRELRGACSRRFVEDCLVHWFRERIAGGTEAWTSTLTKRLAQAVRQYGFRVPLIGIVVEEPFAVGPYRVAYITDRDVAEMLAGRPEENFELVKQKFIKDYQGKVCVEGQATAEASRVTDLALDAAEAVVRALRFVHPSSFEMALRSKIGIDQRVLVPGWRVILRETSERPRIRSGTESRWEDLVVSQSNIALLRDAGLSAAAAFLSRAENSDLNTKAWRALEIFTRGIELGTWGDKLINALVAAETLLLKDANEPIAYTLGMRLAHLLGGPLERRKALVDDLRFAYRRRSMFIHHGDEIVAKDRERLNNVLRACRDAVHGCLRATEPATAIKLLNTLDDASLGSA